VDTRNSIYVYKGSLKCFYDYRELPVSDRNTQHLYQIRPIPFSTNGTYPNRKMAAAVTPFVSAQFTVKVSRRSEEQTASINV